MISEVRYFLDDASETPGDSPERTFFDNDPSPTLLAASVKSVLARPVPNIPKSFTLEVWTGGKPYRSQKYEEQARHGDSSAQAVASGLGDRGHVRSSGDEYHEGPDQ